MEHQNLSAAFRCAGIAPVDCGDPKDDEDLTQLEDQMCQMATDGFMGEGSPDRVDALVWALSSLMVGGSTYDHTMSWVA